MGPVRRRRNTTTTPKQPKAARAPTPAASMTAAADIERVGAPASSRGNDWVGGDDVIAGTSPAAVTWKETALVFPIAPPAERDRTIR